MIHQLLFTKYLLVSTAEKQKRHEHDSDIEITDDGSDMYAEELPFSQASRMCLYGLILVVHFMS